MWLLKISGAALLVLCSSYTGFSAAMNLKKRCETLSLILSVMQDTGEQIRFFGRELADVYKSLTDNGFDSALINGLTDTSARSYLNEFTCLNKKDKAIINSFFSSLGMSDIEGQEKHISVYIKLIEKQISDAETEYSGKARVYKSIGFWGGMSVAVFLL